MRRRSKYRRQTKASELNITPLIDMVFILLIFFLVTASFVKESGVTVQRPVAKTAETKERANLIIGIDKSGVVFIEGKSIDIRSIRAQLDRFLAETPQGSAVIAADKAAPTGAVIQVLDQCRLAGMKDVSIAAAKPSQ